MTQPFKEQRFDIMGMTCGHCQRAVESAIGEISGVQEVRVDLKAGKAAVVGLASDQQIIAAVEDAGYQAVRLNHG